MIISHLFVQVITEEEQYDVIGETSNDEFILYEFPIDTNYVGDLVVEVISMFGKEPGQWTLNDLDGLDVALFDDFQFYDAANVSTENEIKEIGYQIYPNPTTDQLYIVNKASDRPYSLQLYDQLGRLVLTKTNVQKETQLDLQAFQNGMYFIKFMEDGKEIGVKKIVKN